MRRRKLGMAAAVALAIALAACGEKTDRAALDGLTQANHQEPNACEEAEECLSIAAGKNLTHVFLDFACDPPDYDVALVTEHFGRRVVTDRLKTDGGPCSGLARDVRLEVQGPDRVAQICVVFHAERSEVTVGAKAANACALEGTLFAGEDCEACGGAGGAGGAGGEGGTGGTGGVGGEGGEGGTGGAGGEGGEGGTGGTGGVGGEGGEGGVGPQLLPASLGQPRSATRARNVHRPDRDDFLDDPFVEPR